MEPVTTAVLAALAAGAASGAKDVANNLVTEGYEALKALLKRKLGADSKALEAVGKLEEDPESAGWRETVGKELATSPAVEDLEVVTCAEDLLNRIETLPGGKQHIQNAVGSYIAQADRRSTATVNVHKGD